MGDNGSIWAVSVFVLNSQHNDVLAGDEDPIPCNGNPHPEQPPTDAADNNHFPGLF
jgi:hypothetical protein